MKLKLFCLILAVCALLSFNSCEKNGIEQEAASISDSEVSSSANIDIELSETKMMDICKLSTLKCYYHNVIKVEAEKESIWPWAKGKHYWMEYGGIVELGIDVSQVKIEVNGTQVDITIPEAEITNISIDDSTLTGEYFILAKDSAKTGSEDETHAFTLANEDMKEKAQADTEQLERAQQRAETLLEDYVNNIGEATGKTYTVKFHEIENEDTTTSANSEASSSAA